VIDQQSDPPDMEEADRIARVAFIEREITYWVTVVSMWVVLDLLAEGDWAWWQNWIVGAGLAFVANLVSHGHVWRKVS
jgi:hypothetical protein